MNPMIVLVAALAVASASALAAPVEEVTDTCSPQSEKPAFERQVIKEWDDYETRFGKMFRGYLQKEVDGKTMYVPLKLTNLSGRDYGESTVDLSASHNWDKTLDFDCASVELRVTKLRPEVEIIYTFNDMKFQFGDSANERCWLKMIEPEVEGTHAYACNVKEDGTGAIKQVATLVVQQMDLDKFLSTRLPKTYDISWQ